MPSHTSNRPRLQIALLTAAALAAYFGLRNLPRGSDISHNDFRLNDHSAPQFCDASNPQFMPVVSDRSPVKMTLTGALSSARVGETLQLTATLTTASGKLIGRDDLLESHTRLLHLLIVDPTLEDYQHVHPDAQSREGQKWQFTFIPRRAGVYRIFADFMPRATARGLYAVADLEVRNVGPDLGQAGAMSSISDVQPARPRSSATTEHPTPRSEQAADLSWDLSAGPTGLLAGRPTELQLRVSAPSGRPLTLSPVMGAFAHVVAFDPARTGYAHLHPLESDVSKTPDPLAPTFKFKVTIPVAGRYVFWAQMLIDGQERFQRFELHVGQ